MRNSRISATWLSDEMAHALAAIWPPLEAVEVMRAADEIMSHPSPAHGLPVLCGDDAANNTDVEPGMLEALWALHDLGIAG